MISHGISFKFSPTISYFIRFSIGLCGVHYNVTKAIKSDLLLRRENTSNTKIACIGDKSRAILQRKYADKFVFVANEVGRSPPTFLDASKIAKQILESGFTHGRIVFNRFQSVVSYSCDSVPIFSATALKSANNIAAYDSVDPDVLRDYMEHSLASLIFYTMKESACAEQSSRMTTMDNAAKNADEVIDQLTLKFHRTRQAVVTRELLDIVNLPLPASFNIFQCFQYKK